MLPSLTNTSRHSFVQCNYSLNNESSPTNGGHCLECYHASYRDSFFLPSFTRANPQARMSSAPYLSLPPAAAGRSSAGHRPRRCSTARCAVPPLAPTYTFSTAHHHSITASPGDCPIPETPHPLHRACLADGCARPRPEFRFDVITDNSRTSSSIS
jgi:hypothetical protein